MDCISFLHSFIPSSLPPSLPSSCVILFFLPFFPPYFIPSPCHFFLPFFFVIITIKDNSWAFCLCFSFLHDIFTSQWNNIHIHILKTERCCSCQRRKQLTVQSRFGGVAWCYSELQTATQMKPLSCGAASWTDRREALQTDAQRDHLGTIIGKCWQLESVSGRSLIERLYVVAAIGSCQQEKRFVDRETSPDFIVTWGEIITALLFLGELVL